MKPFLPRELVVSWPEEKATETTVAGTTPAAAIGLNLLED